MQSLRRAMLAMAIALSTLAGCTTGSATAPDAPDTTAATARPNIVFILTDDLSSELVDYMPNLQKLQQRGMRFTNYYVTNSLCCPSRATTLTGGYPHTTQVLTNGGADGGFAEFTYQRDDAHTFATSLKDAGYTTALLGKYLNGYRLNPPAPQKSLYVPPGWDNWYVPGGHDGYSGFNYTLNENGVAVQYGNDPEDYLTDVLSAKAVDLIQGAAARQQPLMLEISTFSPHWPYTPAPRHANLFPGLTYPRSPAYDQLGQNPSPWLAKRPPLTAAAKTAMDQAFRMRVQSVQAVDEMIGTLTETLRTQGILDNTYLVFSSDNGLHMGEHRLHPGKMTAFDTDIRVPLIVAGPGVPEGSVNDAITANIDLCPTFEEWGQAAIGPLVDGRSLRPLLSGQTPADWRQSILIEQKYPGTAEQAGPDVQVTKEWPPTYRAARTKDALYIEYADGSNAYYDTDKDPHELNNLAARVTAAQRSQLQLGLTLMSRCSGSSACRDAEAESAAVLSQVRTTVTTPSAQPSPAKTPAASTAATPVPSVSPTPSVSSAPSVSVTPRAVAPSVPSSAPKAETATSTTVITLTPPERGGPE